MAGRVEAPAHPASTEGAGLGGLTSAEPLPILLVDDRTENLRTLEAVLAPLGFPIRTAGSGGEALRMLLEEDFALILLDVRMPGLDGLEAARLIKGRERSREVPLIFLTAAQDQVDKIVQGYKVGAVDYLIKPFDPDLLRSKVAVLAELEASRRALKRSEAFLRGAFEAAPIGKTVLDESRTIVRSNPAFARMLGREAPELEGLAVMELVHSDDRSALDEALERIAAAAPGEGRMLQPSVDVRLTAPQGELWAGAVASAIEPRDFVAPMLLVQWVDLTARRRAEQARAELVLEQAARTQAEATADRLTKLQTLTEAFEALTLEELLPELVLRLSRLFEAAIAEVEIAGDEGEPKIVRVAGKQVLADDGGGSGGNEHQWHETPLRIEQAAVGSLRLATMPGRAFTVEDRALLHDAADRAALSIRRAKLHEEEHRIAVELQRGLLPQALPEVDGIEIAAHYQAAGLGAEVGGDWYDAFVLDRERLGIVVGDVAGRGIPAASAMGQLRSLVRGFALAENRRRGPGEVLTRLNEHQMTVGSQQVFTIVYAVIDRQAGMIHWASAGHPPPLVRDGSGGCGFLEAADGLMGIEQRTYSDLAAPIGSGATVVLYSDGLVERRDESLDAGLRRLLEATAAGPPEPGALCAHLLRAMPPGSGELDDDVTTVVARLS